MRSFTYQAIVAFIVVGMLTYLTDYLGFRSGFNIFWMFGVPIAVATLVNKDAAARCLAGLVCVVLSPVAMMVTAAIFHLGP